MRALVAAVGPVIHGRVLKGLARRRGGPQAGRSIEAEAEDITQEVLLALFDDDGRALRAWDPARAPLGGFVALIADHQVFSIFRSGKRRPWSDDLVALEEPDELVTGGVSPERAASSAEELDALLDALRAELTPKGFDLFLRLYVHEQPTEEIARDLGMTADAIYAWKSRLGKHVRAIAARSKDASDPGLARSTPGKESHAP